MDISQTQRYASELSAGLILASLLFELQFCCVRKDENDLSVWDYLLIVFVFISMIFCVCVNNIYNLFKKYFGNGYTQTNVVA